MRKIVKVNNREEFVAFVISTEKYFDDNETIEVTFGFSRDFDEETGELLESLEDYCKNKNHFDYEPTSYPCYYDINLECKGVDKKANQYIWVISHIGHHYEHEVKSILEVTEEDEEAWGYF